MQRRVTWIIKKGLTIMTILPRSGIYCIVCLGNWKMYIGSASDLRSRKSAHFSDLRRDAHANQYLQHSFNKYGEVSFIFVPLEYCDISSLITREQYYLDNLLPFPPIGFNISTNARHNTLGQKRPPETVEKIRLTSIGRVLSEKQKQELGIRTAELWKDDNYVQKQKKSRTGLKRSAEFKEQVRIRQTGRLVSDETKKRLSDSHKGIKLKPESVAKRSQTNRKTYIVTSPDGIETVITGLDLFCAKHGLRANTMSECANGKLKTCCGGWKCRHAK